MATSQETNTKALPTFSSLEAFEQRAVVLKSEGHSYETITNQINAEFNLTYSKVSIQEWFYASGRLESAHLEYITALAHSNLETAKRKIMIGSLMAVDTLIEAMSKPYEMKDRINAAKAMLNKYVPDRQMLIGGGKKDELPDSLADDADEIVTGASDGKDQVDDQSESKAPSGEARTGTDQKVS